MVRSLDFEKEIGCEKCRRKVGETMLHTEPVTDCECDCHSMHEDWVEGLLDTWDWESRYPKEVVDYVRDTLSKDREVLKGRILAKLDEEAVSSAKWGNQPTLYLPTVKEIIKIIIDTQE